MGMQFKTFKESFRFLKHISYKKNQYYMKGDIIGAPIKKIPIRIVNTLVQEGLIIEQKDLGNNQARSVVSQKAIERFHPNHIDNKEFWTESKKNFPLLSVCGGECKNIKELNKLTLGLSEDFGMLPYLKNLLSSSDEKPTLLEIGFGYGNLFFEIKDQCNYYGIDYNIPRSLKKYKNFIEIDKSGIPDYLLDEGYFDIIYSVNVLQHCSQKDRFDYFKQGYQALKKGGYFIFTLFLMTKQNKDDACWGYVDTKGRGYTQFFNQLTECDWDYELYHVLDNLGFEIVKHGISGNFFMGIVRKK